MNRIFGTLLFLGLLGVAWNLFSAIMYALFGVSLPTADPGMYPG